MHHGLRVRRHHLLAGRAVNDRRCRACCARQVLGDRDRGGDADRPLRAVLVAVKRALGAAQRVVFEDHAERRRAVVALYFATNAVVRPRAPIFTSKSCCLK